MPAQILLRARTRLVSNNRAIQPGTTFHTTPVEAAVLVYRHEAVFAVDDEPVEPRAKSRRYKRRDLQPES
jgi:hypothetical protein